MLKEQQIVNITKDILEEALNFNSHQKTPTKYSVSQVRAKVEAYKSILTEEQIDTIFKVLLDGLREAKRMMRDINHHTPLQVLIKNVLSMDKGAKGLIESLHKTKKFSIEISDEEHNDLFSNGIEVPNTSTNTSSKYRLVVVGKDAKGNVIDVACGVSPNFNKLEDK